MATIRGNQRDIKRGRKTLLFLTNSPTAFPSEALVLASLSPVGASWEVFLGETRHGDQGEEELSWQPWRKFTLCSSFADECWEMPAQLLISGSQGLRAAQSCLSTSCSHGDIWQPSNYLPAIAPAGSAQKAGREKKANPRASHPPGRWEESSSGPHLQVGVITESGNGSGQKGP